MTQQDYEENAMALRVGKGAELPEGIREGEAFDGGLLQERGFQPGRTYWIGPVIPDTGGLRELIIYPWEGEEICFEDSLYTCTFLGRDFSVLKTAEYYLHLEPGKTRWLNKKRINEARSEYIRNKLCL